MSEKVGDIYYDVDADTAGLISSTRHVKNSTKKMGDGFFSLDKRIQSTDKSLSLVKKSVIAVSAALSVRELAQYSDGYIEMQNSLRQVTKGTEDLAAATDIMFEVARSTRTEIGATANLYSKLSKSTKSLNLTQRDLVGITTTINQVFASSGANAQEASNAIRQLGQGLGAGALRGEEFNSVADQAPGILEAVAKETGLGVGQLREYAAQGKITTELLVRSLKNYADTAAKQFNKTKSTSSQAITVLKNDFTELVGKFLESADASELLANSILSISRKIKLLTDLISSGVISDVFISQFELVSKEIKTTTNLIEEKFAKAFEKIKIDGENSGLSISGAFKNIVPNIKSTIKLITTELAVLVEKAGELGKAIYSALNVFDDVSAAQAVANLNKEFDRINSARNTSIELILKENDADIKATDDAIERSKAKLKQYEKEQEAKRKAFLEKSNKDDNAKNKKIIGDSDERLLKTLGVSAEVQARQQTNFELKELERLRREGDLKDEQDYINRKNEIIKQGNERLKDLNKDVELVDWESFGNRAIGSLTSVVTGAESGSEAIKNLARSVLSEAVGALIKLGIQNAIGQSAAVAGAATSGALIATAYAPAAALSSLAFAGTNSAPAIAGITATSTAAKAVALGGGRLNGGPVSPGKLYPVTEDGRPELLTQGNKNYLLPGSKGKVTSNKNISQNSQPIINVNIATLPGQTADIMTSQKDNEINIDAAIVAVANNIDEGGSIFKSIQNRTKAGVRTV